MSECALVLYSCFETPILPYSPHPLHLSLMPSYITVVDFLLGGVGVYLIKSIFFATPERKSGPLPPGPKQLLLIGNLLDLPKGQEWVHWTKHKDLYGPISSVTVFGQHMIIVNDKRLVFEMFDKRSAIYSDRPTLVFGGEMCGWENTLALLHYSERFRSYRKVFHHVMGTKAAIARYHSLEEIETRRFLLRVLDTPNKVMQHIRTNAGAIILKISHGYTIEPKSADPLVDLADEAVLQFSLSAQAGSWLVDVLPFLRNLPGWIPGTGFKRTAMKWRETLMELAERPHAFVRQKMAAGDVTPSFTSDLLSDLLSQGTLSEEEEHVVKWTAASMYSGGADTTVSAIYSFFLAMTLYPEVQEKAQEEIDRVVGFDRFPSFSDRVNLPYIDAMVKEVLRWNPVVPLGLPHTTIEEDTVEGFYIPKGAIVVPNIWQFFHDPEAYHDPMNFKPERFLGPNPELDTHNMAFGFGRRICPGKELADASVFISIAMSLAAFNISKAKTESGQVVEPLYEYTSGIISHPKEFKCSITPRSPKAAALVRSIEEEHPFEASDAKALLDIKWQH